jgi:peroxidase
LLDDTSTFTGEKNAGPNANSARGFEVIDTIKSLVEATCKATVSCADIVALAARDGVSLVNYTVFSTSQFNFSPSNITIFQQYVRTKETKLILVVVYKITTIESIKLQLGGPTWTVLLGRRDARTASQSAANSNLPGPGSSLQTLISMFANKGLNARDMTALSGAHTIGQARCVTFRSHIYSDTNINANFAATRKQTCPQSGGDGNLAPIDVQTPARFDNAYYQNLVAQRGLFHSDQELFNGGSQDSLVRTYSTSAQTFNSDFVNAMIKMGNISPLTGTNGEIRLNCRKPN